MSDRLTACGGRTVIAWETPWSHLAYALGDSVALGRGGYPRAMMSSSESSWSASSVSAGRIVDPAGAGMERAGAGISSVGDAATRKCTGWIVTTPPAVQSRW